MREKYETLKLNDLREIAKQRGIKSVAGLKKAEIIDLMCQLDEQEAREKDKAEREAKEAEEAKASKAEAAPKSEASEGEKPATSSARRHKNIVVMTNNQTQQDGERKPARPAADRVEKPARPAERAEKTEVRSEDRAENENRPVDKTAKVVRNEKAPETASKEEVTEEIADGDDADGILEVMQDGYGFIRCENYLPGENDVYVAPSLIRKFNLKTGDILKGRCRAKKETDKFAALSRLDTVNGYRPEVAMGRWNFENMTPIFPNSRIKLEQPGCSVAMRIMDLISPIGNLYRVSTQSELRKGF